MNETQRVGNALIRQGFTPFKSGDDEYAWVAPPENNLTTLGWKVLQRNTNKWVQGCTITESVREHDGSDTTYRRFTATIRGWRGFKIWEGAIDRPAHEILAEVIGMVTAVRDRIDSGDESDFYKQTSTRL